MFSKAPTVPAKSLPCTLYGVGTRSKASTIPTKACAVLLYGVGIRSKVSAILTKACAVLLYGVGIQNSNDTPYRRKPVSRVGLSLNIFGGEG